MEKDSSYLIPKRRRSQSERFETIDLTNVNEGKRENISPIFKIYHLLRVRFLIKPKSNYIRKYSFIYIYYS